jgi:hypothetical protein
MSVWSVVPSSPDSASTNLRHAWRDLLAGSGDPFKMLQSPEWFDLECSVSAHGDSQPFAAVLRNAAGEVVGIVPIYPREGPCEFRLFRGRTLVTPPKEMVEIPSGNLLLPPGDRWFDGLFVSLARHESPGRIVWVSNVPASGALNHYLLTSRVLNRLYCRFDTPTNGNRRWKLHTMPLPRSYDLFLSKYSSKKQYNLRRQLRQLEQRAQGGLRLRRYETAEDVAEFRAHWDQLALHRAIARSGPSPIPLARAIQEQARLMGELGLLCSYMLLDGDRPIAGCFAQRYGPVLLVNRFLHDSDFAAQSPATCLLHMIVKELIERESIRLINLGCGAPRHENQAANVALDYVSYWLIPRTWRSRSFQIAYTGLRGAIAAVKSVLHRPAAPPRQARPQAEEADDRTPVQRRQRQQVEGGLLDRQHTQCDPEWPTPEERYEAIG